jgi:mono/diheme cytochrome c family protein
MKRISLFGILTLAIAACTSQKPNQGTTTEKPIVVTPSTNENLAQGKVLFENNCGKCHDLPSVTSFNDEKWKSVVDWMAPKPNSLPNKQIWSIHTLAIPIKIEPFF